MQNAKFHAIFDDERDTFIKLAIYAYEMGYSRDCASVKAAHAKQSK